MGIMMDRSKILETIESYHEQRVNKRNPVFLYGPSRSGKTTLLQKIEDHFSGTKGVRVLRLDAEELAIELVKSIRNRGDKRGFYYKFLDYDVLLVDNLWVLQGKPRTIEEIFHLFKTFIDKGKLLVMALDIPPETLLPEKKVIKEIQERSITFKMKPFYSLSLPKRWRRQNGT
jgi:chromosomal replication initiator protein